MKYLDVPMSGSLQSRTYSRNRYGQYQRSRATPVNPATSYQTLVRGRLTAASTAWRALTDSQRMGWEALGLMMSRSDSLGQSYTLNGFTAYVSVNSNLLSAGDAAVSDAPAIVTPGALATVTTTLTAIAFSIAYTATPLPALTKLLAFLSPMQSAGRQFNADFRLVHVSAAAAASPANVLAAYTARCGVPVVGTRIFWSLVLHKGGFLSSPVTGSQVVA